MELACLILRPLRWLRPPVGRRLVALIEPARCDHLAFRLGGETVFADEVEIPARPFVGLSADGEAEVLALLADYITGPFDGRTRCPRGPIAC